MLCAIKYFVMTFDVAVIGAGLAGLQTSRLLARRGLRVLLIDRKESLADTVHTTGIFVRRTWEDFPLPDEQLGPAIREVFLHSPSSRVVHLASDRDEFRIGRMEWIYLSMLDACDRAGVHFLPSAWLAACDHGRVKVARRIHTEEYGARFIVGADGPCSTVARHLGLDRNSEFLVGLEVVVAARSEAALHCFVDPRIAPGYIAWVASDGRTAHVGVAGYRHRFDPARSLEIFRSNVAHLAGENVIERRGGLIPVNGILHRIANEQGLLVGDAAGAVSPLTAGGFDGAMRLSSFAAEVVAEYLEREDPAVLRQYDGARFRAQFVTRRWMRSALRVASHPLLIEMAFAAMAVPPVRAIARRVFFGEGSFPDARLLQSMLSRTV